MPRLELCPTHKPVALPSISASDGDKAAARCRAGFQKARTLDDSESNSQGLKRVLLDSIQVQRNDLLRFAGRLWKPSDVPEDFKSRVVLAANVGFNEGEDKGKVK